MHMALYYMVTVVTMLGSHVTGFVSKDSTVDVIEIHFEFNNFLV